MRSAIRSVADARARARRTLPRVVYDYVDGGAEDEITMAENEAAFRRLAFRPRVAVDTGEPHLATSVLGTPVSLPVLLAPCGLVRLMHPDGPAGVGRAAASRQTVWVLSTVAGAPLEDVASAGGHRWFQLYASGGRPEAAATIERAEAAGYEALVVTVDTPALGNRERDTRNGVTSPLRLDARTAVALGPQVLARPRWALRMMRSGVSMLGRPDRKRPFGADRPAGVVDSGDSGGASTANGSRPAGAGSPGSGGGATGDRQGVQARGGLAAAGAVAMLASPFTWADIAWMRQRWSRPLVVKGVLGAHDARAAADAGADAVIVSNHGGRQLDGAPATVRVLPEVADAVGQQLEVLVDGGVRRGGDVIKALALGAKAVLVGRPYLYGLAVDGQRGVEEVLDVMRSEMARSMRLLGCPSVAELDRSYLESPTSGIDFDSRM